MAELLESRRRQVTAPGFQIVVGAVALAVPAFLVTAVRIRTEQYSARLERGPHLSEHARQLLAWHVEQRRVGEHPVEARRRQLQPEEVLLPDLAAALAARHGGEARRAFQAHRDMAERGESLEIATRPAAEIEDRERRPALDVPQQLGDVLADVVVARPALELVRALVVVLERVARDVRQLPAFEHPVRP